MSKATKGLDALEQKLEKAGMARFRSVIAVCSDEDVAEVEAAKEAGARVYVLCNPQHAHLLGGSIRGAVIAGMDLARDV